jgi:predicted lipoprotein with Yx(FWY)xxD motif
MIRLSRLVAGFLMIGVLAACATATSMGPGGLGTTRQTGLGEVFADADGMTLYTYDKDTRSASRSHTPTHL